MDLRKYKASNFMNNFSEDNSILHYSFHFSNEAYHNVNRLRFRRLRIFNYYELISKEKNHASTNYNFESVYIVLEGKLSYDDDLGNHETFDPYSIFSISAGKGIRYSFQNKSRNNTLFLEMGFFPNQKSLNPQLQKLIISNDHFRDRMCPIVTGEKSSAHSMIVINQNIRIFFTIITGGNLITHPLLKTNDYYIYVIKGALKLENQHDIESRESCRVTIKYTSDIMFVSNKNNADLEFLLIEMQKDAYT